MSGQGSRGSRLTFGKFVDRAFWLLLVFLARSIPTTLHSINSNIQALNEKMAAIVEKVASQEKRMDGFDARLERVELYHLGEPTSLRSSRARH